MGYQEDKIPSCLHIIFSKSVSDLGMEGASTGQTKETVAISREGLAWVNGQ